MTEHAWNEFWWTNITGPHRFVSMVAETLLDGRMAVLAVPTDLPWRYAMRGAIHYSFKERMEGSEVLIEPIDVVDDNPENMEPGRFILSRFAPSTVRRGYREKSKVSIQDYIKARNVTKNRIIWVKGLRGEVAQEWIRFCREFHSRSFQEGLFVLEVQGGVGQQEVKPLTLIDFGSFVSSYDVQLFNSTILDWQDRYPDPWKKYIAAVTASLCDTDAEISAILLEDMDFRTQSAMDGLASIAEDPDYARRGEEEDSGHVLWHTRHGNMEELKKRIWSAQIQVLFPIIEMERVKVIERGSGVIQEALDTNEIAQFNEPLARAIDVELGTLCYMMKTRTKHDDSLYILYIPDEKEREWISFIHDCRNRLAHVSCCTSEQIGRLLMG